MNQGMERKARVGDTFSFHLQMKCSTMSWMFGDKRQLVLYNYTFFFFLHFYNLSFTPVELPARLMLVWGRTSRFACLHQLHSCTFCTEVYLHRCLPKFLFCSLWTFLPKWTITIRKQILAEKMHERCFNDRTVTWTLTLRHVICFLLPWDAQWIVTLWIITCSRGIYFTNLGHILDLSVYVSWFIFVFTAQIQVLYTLQMSLWRYLGLKITYIYKRLFIWAFVKAWTDHFWSDLIQYFVLGPHYRTHLPDLRNLLQVSLSISVLSNY